MPSNREVINDHVPSLGRAVDDSKQRIECGLAGVGRGWAIRTCHNALRINYIIKGRLSRDLLVVGGVHGVHLGQVGHYFLHVCR